MEKKRVIVYVDGYNFYYGLKHGGSKWKRLYWLDVVKFFERMMLPDQELIEVNYYSARPVDDPQAYYNQDKLFHANELNPKFKLHLGLYKKKKIKCQNCGFKIKTYEEKESDVRVATGMLMFMCLYRLRKSHLPWLASVTMWYGWDITEQDLYNQCCRKM